MTAISVESPIDFFIVGTPRSGTTLVQRLVMEYEGVSIPPETHFFSVFANRYRWQHLTMESLQARLAEYAQLEISPIERHEIGLVMEKCLGRRASLFALFAAIVQHLSTGSVVGEKTPHHLLWWHPLSLAFPTSRFLWVVRDPRDVVESNLRMPWGMSSTAALAEMWRSDQALLAAAAPALGERLLVVRYEELVSSPVETQGQIGRYLGLGSQELRSPPQHDQLALPDESWKSGVTGPIRSDRVGVWRKELSEAHVAVIEAIAGREMERLGFTREIEYRNALSASDTIRVARVRHARRRRLQRIARIQAQSSLKA